MSRTRGLTAASDLGKREKGSDWLSRESSWGPSSDSRRHFSPPHVATEQHVAFCRLFHSAKLAIGLEALVGAPLTVPVVRC